MTFEESFIREFEKVAGMQPGSLTQQMQSKHDNIPPLVLAKLMRDREDSMGEVQQQFNSLFSKSGGMDSNLKANTIGATSAKENDEYTTMSRDEVSGVMKSQFDTTPQTSASPVAPIGSDKTNPLMGTATQTTGTNDLSPVPMKDALKPNSATSSSDLPSSNKQMPGKMAPGGVRSS